MDVPAESSWESLRKTRDLRYTIPDPLWPWPILTDVTLRAELVRADTEREGDLDVPQLLPIVKHANLTKCFAQGFYCLS